MRFLREVQVIEKKCRKNAFTSYVCAIREVRCLVYISVSSYNQILSFVSLFLLGDGIYLK